MMNSAMAVVDEHQNQFVNFGCVLKRSNDKIAGNERLLREICRLAIPSLVNTHFLLTQIFRRCGMKQARSVPEDTKNISF
jgi:hypothetical protein